MSLFSKKKETKQGCSCGGNCEFDAMAKSETAKAEGVAVKILGSGCKKCNELEANTIEALGLLGMDTNVDHVKDFTQIAAYGVMTTPALVVDEKVLFSGRVLKASEISELIKKHRAIK